MGQAGKVPSGQPSKAKDVERAKHVTSAQAVPSLCVQRGSREFCTKVSATEVSFIRTGEVMHRQRQLRKAQYIQKVYLVPQQVTPFSSQVLVLWSTPV